MNDVIKTADDLLDRFKRETGYWPPARSAPMEMGDPYSGCEKERIVNDLFHTWRSRARLEAEVASLTVAYERRLRDLSAREAEVAELKAARAARAEGFAHERDIYEATSAKLKLKLDQARGDIRHIREYEVKPRDEAFRELRLNDDIADYVELVLRERGLLED